MLAIICYLVKKNRLFLVWKQTLGIVRKKEGASKTQAEVLGPE
jgi:hypothetical protein